MKEIRIVYKTPQFEAFYASLPAKVQTKFKYVIDVITTIYDVSTKFVKHLENTDLYEMRVSVGNNEYRTILFAVLLSTGNCKIINLSEENILWGFKI